MLNPPYSKFMLKTILSLFFIAPVALTGNPSSLLFNFDSNTGDCSLITFQSGVGISKITIGGHEASSEYYASFTSQKAKLSAREPNHTLMFTVSIDEATSISLDQISFDYGFNEAHHPNEISPFWSLQISQGNGRPSKGALATISQESKPSSKQTIQLKGLESLSNTEVTFILTFHTKEKRHAALNRSHIIDNIKLSGTTLSSPAKAPNSAGTALMSIGGISLILR